MISSQIGDKNIMVEQARCFYKPVLHHLTHQFSGCQGQFIKKLESMEKGVKSCDRLKEIRESKTV